tara:strand:- start:365 stop:1108 length:744 start_codon:yes stop_codon:yes gene_type:complete
MIHRYQLKIEYVGTKYYGWQIQKKGKTIQKTLQTVLKKIFNKKVQIFGSGRTDTGVHAIEQSAHFDIDKKIPNLNKFLETINFFLKNKDISILKINKKNRKFHARFSAKERIYNYIIFNRSSEPSLNKLRGWHIKKKLDIKLMIIGSKKLLGTKDFATFRSSNCGAKSSIKTLKSVRIKIKGEKIEIKFKSKSFLKQQVRSMVGCLKYLGEKKWNLEKFIKVMNSKKRSFCAPPAPPHGLYLEKVIY